MQPEFNDSISLREKINRIERILNGVIKECKVRIDDNMDPLGESLLETTAKVLENLNDVFHAYHVSNESMPVEGVSPKSIEPWD